MSVNTITERPASTILGAPRVEQAAGPTVQTIPAYLEVRYWQEDDGSWSASLQDLRVTAVADSEPELFAETAEAVDHLWEILNERYATLSEDMRRVLELRGLELKFVRV